MVKNIISMSIWQTIVVFVLVFSGEFWIPEEITGYTGFPLARPDGKGGWVVFPGRMYNWDKTPLWKKYRPDYGFSRHFTVVFHVFVLLQIFNMLNARKINDEKNILEGVCKNSMFVFVWVTILVVQVVIAQFTGLPFACCRAGLTGTQ